MTTFSIYIVCVGWVPVYVGLSRTSYHLFQRQTEHLSLLHTIRANHLGGEFCWANHQGGWIVCWVNSPAFILGADLRTINILLILSRECKKIWPKWNVVASALLPLFLCQGQSHHSENLVLSPLRPTETKNQLPNTWYTCTIGYPAPSHTSESYK